MNTKPKTAPEEIVETGTALALPAKADLQTAFTDGSITGLISRIEAEVRSFVPDLSTAKTRAEIRTLAHKVSKSKAPLDEARKELTEEWRAKTASVNKHWKDAETKLNDLRDEVKSPLSDWENTDETRKAAHRGKMVAFHPERTDFSMPAADIETIVAEVEAIEVGEDWEEFQVMAEEAKGEALEKFKRDMNAATIRETQEAEIQKLRDAAKASEVQAAQDKAKREEADRIAKESADKAAADRAAEDDERAEVLAREAKARAEEQAEADRQALVLEKAAQQAEQERIYNDKAAIDLMDYIAACGKGMIGPDVQPFGLIMYELETKVLPEIMKLAEADRPRAEQHRKNVLEMVRYKAKVETDRIDAENAEAKIAAEKEAAERMRLAEQEAIERTRKEEADRIAAEAANKAAEAARLLSDDKHRKMILAKVTKAMSAFDVADLAQAILDGKIPHVKMEL